MYEKVISSLFCCGSLNLSWEFKDHGIASPFSDSWGTFAIEVAKNKYVLSWLSDYRGCDSLLMVNATYGDDLGKGIWART